MALRIAVFVHEQRIVDEVELDGADLLPTTELFWMEDDGGEVTATLRVLADHDPVHIGRVATATTARGRGYAGRLLEMYGDLLDDIAGLGDAARAEVERRIVSETTE